MKAFSSSAASDTTLQAKRFAMEAYPLWQQSHPGKACPDKLAELFEYADTRDGKDAWGREFTMLCGPTAPTGSEGFGVFSVGPDGKEGTADDIKSWVQ